MSVKVVQQKPCIIHCQTVHICLKNLFFFLTVAASEIVEQLKKYIQSLIMSFDLVLSIFPKKHLFNVLQCTNSRLCVVTNFQAVI